MKASDAAPYLRLPEDNSIPKLFRGEREVKSALVRFAGAMRGDNERHVSPRRHYSFPHLFDVLMLHILLRD